MSCSPLSVEQVNLDQGTEDVIKALVIDDSKLDQLILKKILTNNGYDVCIASNGHMAIEMSVKYQPDIVLMNLNLPDTDGYELTKILKGLLNNRYVPVLFVTAINNDESLGKCLESGGDDFIVKPIKAGMLKARMGSLLRVKKMHDELLFEKELLSNHSDQQLKDLQDASRVINNIQMPRFYDSGNINWSYVAQNILSGDILCSAAYPSGNHIILVGDNTGHGLPAAIGSMITCETFYSMVEKGFDIHVIIEEINKKLYHLLPSDRFLAACIMEFDADYNGVNLWTAGIPNVLICNVNGELKESLPSMHFALGIKLINEKEVIPVRINLDEGDRIYAYTDGLTEVFNNSGQMYGEQRLLDIIKISHTERNRVSAIIKDTKKFSENAIATDDVLLLEVSCDKSLVKKSKKNKINSNEIEPMNWQVKFEFQTDVISKSNPIPTLIQTIVNIQGFGGHREKLFLILTEMYSNAVEHGILKLDSSIKEEENGFLKYYDLRQSRLEQLEKGNITIEIEHYIEGEKGVVLFKIENDGAGFDYDKVIANLSKHNNKSGRGIPLLYDLCRKCEYSNGGRKLAVEYEWQLEIAEEVA
jgi:two-component system, HptB-dependent secretion and biofilm response regulator